MVIDTNVLAHAAFGAGAIKAEALAVLGFVDVISAPDSLHAELAQTAWRMCRVAGLDPEAAASGLAVATRLVAHCVSTASLSEEAFLLALRVGHAAYDTLFVVLAQRLGTKLVTYDERVLALFPDVAVHPSQLLG